MEKTTSFGNPSDDHASTAVQRGVASAGAALHQGIDTLADPARNTVESLSASAHQTVDSLVSGAGRAAERFADKTHTISEAPGKLVDGAKSTIQDRPLEAVAIALALGFVLGRLTAR